MSVMKGTSDNFAKEVLQSEIPVLVDFNADWCGPCRMLAPVLEEIAKERTDRKIVAVNVDDESELAEEYGIASIPCLVLFQNGAEAQRIVGFRPKEEIEALLGEN